jgi:hypothetical protein
MTRDQLDAIRARVEAATPGPWKAQRWCSNNPSVAEAWGLTGMRTFADAVFCGHAREDVPALLAEVERLQAREAELLRWRDEWAIFKAAQTAGKESAFARGAAAMREAAARLEDNSAKASRLVGTVPQAVRHEERAKEIRALPIPEDK